jgi:hypothetical protein
MHGRPPTGPNPWRWGAIGLLVVLLAWLVPNPLPWRSPFQRDGQQRVGAEAVDLSVGAEVAARTQLSVSAPAPPATPRPVPPRVPPGFHGAWRGDGVNFLGGGTFSVTVTFPARATGAVVATADFPTLGCQEVWQLEKSAPAALTLRATLAAGLCVVRPLRVQAKLLDRTHLFVQWQLLNSVVESEARLDRVS